MGKSEEVFEKVLRAYQLASEDTLDYDSTESKEEEEALDVIREKVRTFREEFREATRNEKLELK